MIVTQWGNESGWGGPNISQYYNPASQKYTCDVNIARCGSYGNGFAVFCNIKDGVKGYSQLIRIGYPHVASAYIDAGLGASGMKAAAIALGQGYQSGKSFTTDYCFTTTKAISSSSPRLWDEGQYNNGNDPGSKLYSLINDNSCLSDLNYVQTTDPRLPSF